MGTRPNLPKTSKKAYDAAKKGMIEGHHQKIIEALQKAGKANYEKLAAICKMDRHQVGRRLSELERKMIVYKFGTTSKTKSGREADDYCLCEGYTLKVEHPAKQLIETTESANNLLKQLQTPLF